MLTLTGGATDPNGRPFPPGLVERGPVLRVVVSVTDEHAKILAEHGEPNPNTVPGLALIDTGALVTCIDDSVAVDAGLPVVDKGRISSATDTPEVSVYAGKIVLVQEGQSAGVETAQVEARRAFGVNILNQGIIALIGRDVLTQAFLLYIGPEARYTLVF